MPQFPKVMRKYKCNATYRECPRLSPNNHPQQILNRISLVHPAANGGAFQIDNWDFVSRTIDIIECFPVIDFHDCFLRFSVFDSAMSARDNSGHLHTCGPNGAVIEDGFFLEEVDNIFRFVIKSDSNGTPGTGSVVYQLNRNMVTTATRSSGERGYERGKDAEDNDK
ncbi:hypothetical protein PAAG_11561 [Paracoccidioides lutzii Pb01]|uniref:Uncharacterized protein n=1 Tax=Paracoccidioides lutzii (strain ATCC MYA-826 / Pb01) TaxID=502779 RepID=A0A0A2VLJ4_PARBA|nr:hypothetical protein PAAG_11561 [Paracoccidioides lutzii Pb01]KGQ01714.1 hypothetical protein PAAG_11561 [Paracoccidioides lutzii Pb01]